MNHLVALGSFESQLVLLPVLLIVVVGLFALVITDLEFFLDRRLREDRRGEDLGTPIIKLPRRRRRPRRRGGQLDPVDLQRALLDAARESAEA